MQLIEKKCVACEGGVPRLPAEEVARLMPQVAGWQLLEQSRKLSRRFVHDNFVSAMAFVGRMATLAEAEGHHPDFCVHYSVVDVTIWTHDIGGLSENDFILAAKIDLLVEGSTARSTDRRPG